MLAMNFSHCWNSRVNTTFEIFSALVKRLDRQTAELPARLGLSCCFLSLFFFDAFAGISAGSEAPTEHPITWVFLNTGAGREKTKGMAKEAVQKMQAEHVGNFGNLFNQGRLFAAGPLGDNGFIRGTLILNVESPDQVADCFKPDPFVQNDILAVEAHPWLVDIMKFGTPRVPFQLASHTLCIVKKGKNWQGTKLPAADEMLHLFPDLKAQARSGELALGGPFLDPGDRLGVLMFYSSNQAQIKVAMEKEPAVTDARVELEFHPQFMGAGTFRVPGQDNAPPRPGKQTRLFDRKSFKGWEGDTQRTWRIQNGALIGGSLSETVPHNEFLCATNQFENFDLRLKVKLTGTGFVNGGIQVRSQRLREPAFEMTGYQADMGEGYWGSLYDESRRNKTLAHTHAAVVKRLVKPDDWNDYIIRCEGPHIRLWLNGVLTVDYTEDDKSIPLKGLIGLQIHGGGKAEAAYKDITIESLP